MKMRRFCVSLLVSTAMVLSFLPGYVLAEDDELPPIEQQVSEETTADAREVDAPAAAAAGEASDDPTAGEPADDSEAEATAAAADDGTTDGTEGEPLRASSVSDEEYTTADGWKYRIVDGEAGITGYTGTEASVTIPEELDGLPVTSIFGESAFRDNRAMKELIVPPNIKVIEAYSLRGGVFKTIVLNTNLDPIDDERGMIPESVTRIVLGKEAETLPFYESGWGNGWLDGDKLEEYVVDEENPYYTAVDGVLFSKDMTQLIRYPKNRPGNVYTVPDGTTEICRKAFYGSVNLTELGIPASVTTFGDDVLGAADTNYWSQFDDKFVVRTTDGSAAEDYATKLGVTVVYDKTEDEIKKDNAERTTGSSSSSVWNGKDATEVLPTKTDYYVSTAAELKWLSDQVAAGNSFKGYTILLKADIDLNDKTWFPIGTRDAPFRGSFNGQGHTISNFVLDGSAEQVGLFGLVRADKHSTITLKNVKIRNVTKTDSGGSFAGGLAGAVWNARGGKITVTNVSVSGTLGGCRAGGAIGELWTGHAGSRATVSKVNSTVSILDGGGGIISTIDMDDANYEGGFNGSVTVKDCKYKGDCHGGSGIVGSLENSNQNKTMLIEHCKAVGEGCDFAWGGIISGLPAHSKIKSCVVYGYVSSYNAGGITCNNNGTIEECYFEGATYAHLGGNNGALVGINDGHILNCYNGGEAPNSSALSYNGSIASCGSGVVENSYNIGAGAQGGNTSVAVSHPGVFGYTSGQTLINSYYDNSFGDYIFGNVEQTGIVNDSSLKISGSGGMPTSLMKTEGSYVGWDFANTWGFDYDYSWGYPTLNSIKDLLRKHPDTETKNKLKNSKFKFTVVDQAAEPVEGAIIMLAEGTSDEVALTTDKLGKANTPWQDGTVGIKITKDGYVPYIDAGFAMNAKREITLMIIDSTKVDEYPLASVVMEQQTKTPTGSVNNLRYELLTQTRTINRQWSYYTEAGLPVAHMEYRPFTLRVRLADPSRTYTKAELIQENNTQKDPIAVASDPMNPVFSELKYEDFVTTKAETAIGNASTNDVLIRMTDANGYEVTQKVNLLVEDAADLNLEVSFDDGISITAPADVPVIGGKVFEFPACKSIFKGKVTDDGIEFGIGWPSFNFEKEDDEIAWSNFWKNWKKTDKNKLKDNASLRKQIEKFMKFAKDPSLAAEENGWGKPKISVKVLGYAHADLPYDHIITGHLVVELSLKMSGETQVLYVGVVALDGKGKITGDGSLDFNFQNAKLEAGYVPKFENGKITLAGEVSFGIFAGVGIANFVAGGIYGEPALGVVTNVVGGDHQGLDSVYLKGKVSVAFRALGSNVVEHPLVSGTYTVYDWADAHDPTSQGGRNLMSILKAAPEEAVIESDEVAAGAWTGDDAVLQESAYSGSAPVVMTAGGKRVMLFTSNTDISRAAADRSELMYSVYDPENGSWGDPLPVCDDSTADFYPSVSGKYVVWNNATGTLSGCATYNDLGKRTEVCVAEFDAATSAFVGASTITSNNVYENRLAISGGDDPVITWTTDADDNILGLGSSNTFHSAVPSGGTWTVSQGHTEDHLIISKVTGKMGGETYQFYIADEDRDLTTAEDQRLYAGTMNGEASLVTDIAATQLLYAEGLGKLFFIDGIGNLYSLSSVNAEPVQETDDNRLAGAAIVQVIDDGSGNVTLIVTKDDAASRNPYLMRYDATAARWSSPAILLEQNDYVEGIQAWYEGDELVYVYNQRQVQLSGEDTEYSESNSLRWSRNATSDVELVVSDAFFYPDQLVKGQDLPVTVFVANKGLRDLDRIGVRFETERDNQTQVVSDEVVDKVICAGKDTMIEVNLPIAEDAVKADYTLTVYDPDNTDISSQATLANVGAANFQLDKEVYSIGGHEIITAQVTNTGLAAGRGKLVFYDVNDPDEVLDTFDFDSLEPDEIVHYSFRPEERGLQFTSLRIGIRVVNGSGQVVSDERQAQLWREAELPVTGVMLTTNQVSLSEVGETTQLVAEVRPASATDHAALTWTSSNPDAISVDDQGLVTFVKPGKATITVFTEDERYYDECLVYAGTEDIAGCTVKGLRTRYSVDDYDRDYEIRPSFRVVSGNELLVAGIDYTYEYTNNTQVGDAHLIITGKGHYTGTIDKVFKIKYEYAYDKPDVTGIALDKHDISLVTDSDEDDANLRATITPEDAGDTNVIWTSSDESVATVSGSTEYGYVKAVGAGTCTITARTRDGDFTDTCTVTVKAKVNANAIEILPPGNAVILTDGEMRFRASVLPEDAYDKGFYVDVANDDLLDVVWPYGKDDQFILEAQGKTGRTTVTIACSENEAIKKTFTVRVTDNENEAPDYQDMILDASVGDDSVSFEPANYDVDEVTRTSSDESILRIDEDGYGVALKPGNVVVTSTGTDNGTPFTVKTYVKVAYSTEPISSVYLSTDNWEDMVYVGRTLQIKARTYPSVPRNSELIWTSDNESVATVDENGLVTGISPGTAVIKAEAVDHVSYYDEVSDTYEVTVEEYVPLVDVSLDEAEVSVPVNGSVTLPVRFTPENASEKEITWSGGDDRIAQVYEGWDDEYVVYGINVGSTTYTGTTEDGLSVNFTANVYSLGSMQDAVITLSKREFIYDGTRKEPAVTVVLDGKTLVEGQDYYLYYDYAYGPGTAYVEVVGRNGYTGYAIEEYEILEPERISLLSSDVTVKNVVYTGKALTPAPVVKHAGKTLVKGTDYTVRYANNVGAGTARVTVVGIGSYQGAITKSFTIAKAANPLTAKGKTVKLKASALKKAKKTVKRAKAIKIAGAQGTVTYKKKSGNKKITISKKTGKITVKKGLKKGKYKIKVVVSAAGNANYQAAKKTIKLTINVK